MYWIVWSFDVKPEQVKAFERIYEPDGEWVRLFRRAPGFVGSELRRERAAHYITIDRWRTRDDFQRFQETFRDEYQKLDARCGALTELEQKIGDFETSAKENVIGGS